MPKNSQPGRMGNSSPAMPMMMLMMASVMRIASLSTRTNLHRGEFLDRDPAPRYGEIVTNEELLAALDRRFDAIEKRFDANDSRWETNDRRWEENNRRWEEYRRHVDVRFEAVDDKIEQLVEAIVLVDEKLERFRDETNRRFDELTP